MCFIQLRGEETQVRADHFKWSPERLTVTQEKDRTVGKGPGPLWHCGMKLWQCGLPGEVAGPQEVGSVQWGWRGGCKACGLETAASSSYFSLHVLYGSTECGLGLPLPPSLSLCSHFLMNKWKQSRHSKAVSQMLCKYVWITAAEITRKPSTLLFKSHYSESACVCVCLITWNGSMF